MEILSSHSIFKQMIRTAARLEVFANRYLFSPLGLSSTTLKILHALSLNAVLTPSQLIKVLNCTKSNITQRLNLLEKNGLIRRIPLPAGDDHRQVGLVLTEAGKRKYDETIKVLREKGSVLERHFGNQEKADCLSFMKKVNLILDHYEHDRNS